VGNQTWADTAGDKNCLQHC